MLPFVVAAVVLALAVTAAVAVMATRRGKSVTVPAARPDPPFEPSLAPTPRKPPKVERPRAAVPAESPKLILATAVGRSDPGPGGTSGEEHAYVCLDEHSVYAIADGRGDNGAGAAASTLTIEAITEVFTQRMLLDEAKTAEDGNRLRTRLVRTVQRANQLVFAAARESKDQRGMGATLTLAQFSPSKASLHVAQTGGRRCCRIRAGKLVHVGVDATSANVLGVAAAIEPNAQFTVSQEQLESGDQYLLCSDSLSRTVPQDKILLALKHAATDLDGAARKLIERCDEAGGGRAAVILIRVDPAPRLDG